MDTSGDSDKENCESNYMQQYSPEELRDLQMKDSDLKPLLQWMEKPEETPEQGELLLQSPSTRHFWLCRSQLRVINRVLYYEWISDDKKSLLLIVPKSLQNEIVSMHHDTHIAGHLGRDKTLAKIRERCYWYGLSRDVRIYVAGCKECNQNKRQTRYPRAPLQNFQAGQPGDRVHLDILGPFNKSSQGNRYVLMVIDQFTRWLEMIPLQIQDAESIARAFFESYVVRFGVPFVVHTDQGRNFDSTMFKTFCSLLQSVKTRTTPYRPSSNGQVERYNQLVLNFIRCFLGGKPKQWDQFLPELGMSIRSMVNRNTGFTPNMLQLGREINMPADVLLGTPRKEEDCSATYVQQLLERMGEVHAEVRQNLRGAQVRQKNYYDVRTRTQKFDVGDLVYRRNASTIVGQSRKLNPLYIGPYLVMEVISPYLYRVEDRRRSLVVHHDRLKICEDRQVPFWVRVKRHNLNRNLPSLLLPKQKDGAEEQQQQQSVQYVPESDLDVTLPYGTDDSDQEMRGDDDLDATLPYGVTEDVDDNLDATLPYGVTEDIDNDLDATLAYGVTEEVEDGIMAEQEQTVGEPTSRKTRSGRSCLLPAYLRDFAL